MIEIKYPGGSIPDLTYRGRNRYGKQTGIALMNHSREGQEVMRLSPITARGRVTDACHLEVPADAVPALIYALQACVADEMSYNLPSAGT